MSDKTEVPDKSKILDKLEKFLTGGDIILNYLISDERVNDIFEITISNTNDNQVSSLVNEIRNCHLDQFQDIDLASLALYKVAFVADNIIINNLRNINEFEVEGDNRKIEFLTHFPIQPQRIYSGEKEINVIVYPPTEMVLEVLSKDK
ncbi:hypothetical protein C1645_700622 [Glomus cerebriforme]|uniref:Crinkler effector protein N-terminal domain-containing protein n=1 Tax=Glomus cerebriforme TaxID=658196 RepID=A0A397SG05_9GLOM|nr:hypothetical protein C1645_700622 [Glomus cerebriforme]